MTNVKSTAGFIYSQQNGLHIYRFSDNRRASIDAWAEQEYQNDADAAARHEPAVHLMDLRGHWITPYAVVKAVQNARRTPPGLREATAVIAGDTFVAGILESVIHQFPSSVKFSTRVFRTEEAALDWLQQRQRDFAAEESQDRH